MRGKVKIRADVREFARSFGVEAIDNLAAIMNDTTQPGTTRVAAIKELLDRGYGKPTQFIAGDSEEPPVQFGAKVDWDNVPIEALKAILSATSGDD